MDTHHATIVGYDPAATAFTVLFAVGGVADIPVQTVFAAMVGWHSLIGIGEAIITGLVVSAVVATRPDLVFAARPILEATELEIRQSGVAA